MSNGTNDCRRRSPALLLSIVINLLIAGLLAGLLAVHIPLEQGYDVELDHATAVQKITVPERTAPVVTRRHRARRTAATPHPRRSAATTLPIPVPHPRPMAQVPVPEATPAPLPQPPSPAPKLARVPHALASPLPGRPEQALAPLVSPANLPSPARAAGVMTEAPGLAHALQPMKIAPAAGGPGGLPRRKHKPGTKEPEQPTAVITATPEPDIPALPGSASQDDTTRLTHLLTLEPSFDTGIVVRPGAGGSTQRGTGGEPLAGTGKTPGPGAGGGVGIGVPPVTAPLHPSSPSGDADSGNQSARVSIHAKPVYPLAARKHGIEGDVLFQVSIDAQGRKVGTAKLLKSSGDSQLDAAAYDFVEQGDGLTYTPAQRENHPTPSTLTVQISFKLE